uniref:Polyadenylate-binding protein-interacting protein 2 n=1 Tax=Dromaius novaehollandiae TaxID=8790 RepID=A0A8C4J475_DRONO
MAAPLAEDYSSRRAVRRPTPAPGWRPGAPHALLAGLVPLSGSGGAGGGACAVTQVAEVTSRPAGLLCLDGERGGGSGARARAATRRRQSSSEPACAPAALRSPRRLQIKDAAMKDPSRSSTSPSIINEDVIINGHSHEDDNPFAEYMWMENEEEFNRQIEEELWEEEFIERCFQEMLEEEEEHEWFIPARDLPQTMDQIQDQFNDLVISDSSSLEDLVVKSNLNPNAKEFVPGVKY